MEGSLKTIDSQRTTVPLAFRVFVVDDEKVIASTLAAILQLSGFVASFFVDPREALKLASQQCPQLLISDVMMPGMSGIELAIKMKEICPDCKVLLFSGQAATADLLQVAREQGYDFQLLSKPVHPTELLSQVDRLVHAG